MVRQAAEEKKRGRAVKKTKKAKDPNAPKRPQNAYMRFSNEVRADVAKKHNLTAVGDIAKKIGEMWKNMPEAKKAPYQTAYEKDKAAYAKALAKYNAGGNSRR